MLALYLSLLETEEDKTLFARIYEEYRQQMFKYAMQFLKNEDNAEDIVHDIFLFIATSGIEKIRFVENEGTLWAYLSAAVRNQCYLFMRRQKRTQILDPEDKKFTENTRTEEIAEQQLVRQDLLDALRSLGNTYTDVLYYALIQEMKTDKIADLLGIKPAAVRKRISRGKVLLREKLGEDYFDRS